jgi:hypothetical protein
MQNKLNTYGIWITTVTESEKNTTDKRSREEKYNTNLYSGSNGTAAYQYWCTNINELM